MEPGRVPKDFIIKSGTRLCKAACPACDDSPLSTTGNITGILTFTLGLIASCVAFFFITRNANTEIQSLLDIVNETENHIIQMAKHIGRLDLRHSPDFVEMRNLLIDSLRRFKEAQRETRTHLKSFEKSGSPWTYIRWWYMEKETAAQIARLQGYNQRITAIQLTFLLRTTDNQSNEILKNIIPVREDLENKG
ncbi:hypothetical protein QBC40DRAFT_293743 [Triangularia verruculosa]|uniref:Uncharacterized protein n=1 Tax=Triangularia verruculosa TaxID=2587418 RepID=A0AAN6XQ13_9PEZI|nr:hypothetical protein QBC40DRAFT_293743 [Triangularia verruculosa]